MSAPDSSPDQKRVYQIGMNYIQQAFTARMQGNLPLSEKITQQFIDLCSRATQDMSQAATLHEDEEYPKLCQIATSKATITAECRKVLQAKDPEAKKTIVQAMNDTRTSYSIGTFCFAKHLPIPPLDTYDITISKPISNRKIPPEIIRLSITKVSTGSSTSSIRLAIYPPKAESDPVVTDLFTPGDVNLSYDFPVIKRAKQAQVVRLLKKKIVIEVALTQKKFLSTHEVLIARTAVPMELLAARSHISQTFLCQNIEGFTGQVTITICLDVSIALITPEIEISSIRYTALKKGAKPKAASVPPKAAASQNPERSSPKVEAKPAQPKGEAKPAQPKAGLRELSSLSKEELRELKPKIQVGRIMPDWELKRFMSLDLLKKLVIDTGTAVKAFMEASVAVPQKLAEQHKHLNDKMAKIAADIKSGALPKEKYLKLVQTQIAIDKQDIIKFGPDSPEGKILAIHVEIMTNPPKRTA